jgi:predicted aspartyl protease
MSRVVRIAPENAASASERRKLVQMHGHTVKTRIYRPTLGPLDEGQVAFREAEALIDTGASHIFIDASIAGSLGLRERNPKEISTVRGDIGGVGYSALLVVPDLSFREHLEVIAIKGSEKRMNYEIVLGCTFLERFRFEFDGPNGQLLFYIEEPDAISDDYAS